MLHISGCLICNNFFLLLYIFLAARVCWPLFCLHCPFCIYERCLDSNPESCRSKQARYQLYHPSPYGRWLTMTSHSLSDLKAALRIRIQLGQRIQIGVNCECETEHFLTGDIPHSIRFRLQNVNSLSRRAFECGFGFAKKQM